MSKKREPYRPGAVLFNNGVKRLEQAMKPYRESIDYEAIHKLINKDTTVKYNPEIVTQLDLQDPNAFKGELCDLFLTCFSHPITDKNYPELDNDTWRDKVGIKPTTKTGIGAFRDILITMYHDILEAKGTGTLENTHLIESVKHLFTRHTAHKYGHDKRGTLAAMNKATHEGLIYRVRKPKYANEQTVDDDKCDEEFAEDPKSQAFEDAVHRQMLLKKVFETVTDPTDFPQSYFLGLLEVTSK